MEKLVGVVAGERVESCELWQNDLAAPGRTYTKQEEVARPMRTLQLRVHHPH
jgi:hypothetical protein